MHFLDCFPDKNKNFYPQLVVLNSQKTSCITSRLNSTPEFRTRGTPQLFAHTMQSNFRPLAILSTSDSRKTQHSSDQFTKRTHQQSQQSCTEDKEHASDASGQVTTMHRCHQRDFPHAQIGSTLPLAPRPTRWPAHAALPLLTMKDVGSANTERALVGTQVRLCGTTRREALTAVLPAGQLDRDWPSGGTELVAPIVGGNQSTAACRIRASVSTFFQLRGQICANGHLHAGTAGCTTSEPENASRGSNHTYLGAPPS